MRPNTTVFPSWQTTNKLFREARLKSGISQQALAERLGYMSAQIVSNWERGVNPVPEATIKKLCKTLNVPTTEVRETLIHDYKATLKTILN